MTTNPHTTSEFTLRLLNGLLSGVEFSLPATRSLFCVGQAASFDNPQAVDDLQSQSAHTLFIPSEESGLNFAVETGALLPEADFGFELFTSPPSLQTARFNTPCHAGALVFAVKPAADPWSEAVLNYRDAPAPQTEPEPESPTRYRAVILRWLAALSVLLLLGVGAAALWSHFNRDDGMLQSENLARVLQDPNHRFQIRQGRDQVFYVLASSEPDAAWARQTLSRARLPLNLRVLSRAEEQQRIERWLETQGVNYFVLTLNQLQRPELLLSLERGALDSAAAQSLQQKMLLNMPYAESLAFSWLSDAMVLEQAQARLDRLALVYRRQGDPAQGLVFVLGGDIADGVLSQLRTQLNEFERAYGRHYVRFVLNLREDWLQGKSFKYGADGYVQQSPTHWYFPQPL